MLQVTGLTKTYKNNRGIKGIHFSINRGEIKGLLGPNGAGKTTLMKCMVGLAFPDQGEVSIFGKKVHEDCKLALSQVGAYIGTGALYDHLTAYQNLKLAFRFYPTLASTRIDEVLEQVGLTSYKHEKVKGFSMGMRQRLGIASALLSNPSIIILDEPANGLDVDGMIMFRNLIKGLANDGVSFLVSSHLTSELEKICNSYSILIKGELHDIGALPTYQSLEEVYVAKIGGELLGNNKDQYNQ
ncbi:ABC transporter ATP-binding protein [Pseudoneobacillus rhizosphaerae]|uniref:ABC transporter ATP-binding protein n=1 Tax=Pseudoneobacillus rhizosphaerae TaxID=2880968 RepID=UPI001E61A879|nr:ATP-binding cassette domain-containing protein [Pseudoneobacillus rhizosphaerae]